MASSHRTSLHYGTCAIFCSSFLSLSMKPAAILPALWLLMRLRHESLMCFGALCIFMFHRRKSSCLRWPQGLISARSWLSPLQVFSELNACRTSALIVPVILVLACLCACMLVCLHACAIACLCACSLRACAVCACLCACSLRESVIAASVNWTSVQAHTYDMYCIRPVRPDMPTQSRQPQTGRASSDQTV